MEEPESKKGAKFFAELSRRFTREGIEHGAPEDDRLPILLDGREVGVVTPGGAVRVRKEWIDEPEASELFHQAGAVAVEVREYCSLMESAPPLKASSLDAPYKLLADFNGCVLGGMESSHGVQFTTWQWDHGKTGLTHGHYCGNGYAAAKQDFALRCGLVQEQRLFSPEQLTEISRCIQSTLEEEYAMSYEQEKLLQKTQEQIAELVPDLDARLVPTQEQTM